MNFTNLRNSFKSVDNGKEEFDLDNYLNELRQKNKYDPRPDLEEDHELWQLVLKEAEKIDRQVYGNLHGFRCAGCQLEIKDNQLTLIPGQALKNYYQDKNKWQQDRQEYLLPYVKEIKQIFLTVIN